MINTQEHIQGLPRLCEATSVRAVALNCCFHSIKRNSTIIIFQYRNYLLRREKSNRRETENKMIILVISTAHLSIFFSKVPVTMRCLSLETPQLVGDKVIFSASRCDSSGRKFTSEFHPKLSHRPDQLPQGLYF